MQIGAAQSGTGSAGQEHLAGHPCKNLPSLRETGVCEVTHHRNPHYDTLLIAAVVAALFWFGLQITCKVQNHPKHQTLRQA